MFQDMLDTLKDWISLFRSNSEYNPFKTGGIRSKWKTTGNSYTKY